MKYYLDIDRLAHLVCCKRLGRGLREVAKEIGSVSPSTLSRVENRKTPDMETFLALCDWLGVPPAALIKGTEATEAEEPVNTPEAISIQLRADKNLDPAIASALAILISAAYSGFREKKMDEL